MARPQLPLVWIVGWAVVRGRGEAIPWAIFSGLLLDLLSPAPFGVHLIALVVVVFIADLGHQVLHGSTILFATTAALIASVAYPALLMVLMVVFSHRDFAAVPTASAVAVGAALNVLLVLPALGLLRSLDRRFPVPVLPAW